jgi:hypothetical protein
MSGSSGCGGSEDDLTAGELFELAHEMAGLTVLAETRLVETRAEIVEARLGVGQQVPSDGEDGVRARRLPRRLAMRRYRDPRKVAVLVVAMPISPRAPLSQGLPLPVLELLVLPAD